MHVGDSFCETRWNDPAAIGRMAPVAGTLSPHGLRAVLAGWGFLLMICTLLVSGCAQRPVLMTESLIEALPPVYTSESPQASQNYARELRAGSQFMASWKDLAPALERSLAHVSSLSQEDVAVAHGDVSVTWGDMTETLHELQTLLPRLDAEPELFATHFEWLRLTQGADFSGYYEPLLKASLTRKPGFTHPLYRMPPDLHRLNLGDFRNNLIGQRVEYRMVQGKPVPYYTREDIDTHGVLRGKGLELAYVENPVDAFFLQVQGSGRLEFADGRQQHVLYAGQNGRPYVAIGRRMRDLGLLDEVVSMDSVRAWLAEHADQADKVMNINESYVFFRFADTGPVGGMGEIITPWVSLAVDRYLLPLGAPIAFMVQAPFPGGRVEDIRGIGFAQDTGGAIKGRRIDVFCGTGETAAYTAGHLNAAGTAWLLVSKRAPVR